MVIMMIRIIIPYRIKPITTRIRWIIINIVVVDHTVTFVSFGEELLLCKEEDSRVASSLLRCSCHCIEQCIVQVPVHCIFILYTAACIDRQNYSNNDKVNNESSSSK